MLLNAFFVAAEFALVAVRRTRVDEIRETGRNAQGVRVMNIKDDDEVSAVAPVMEGSSEDKVVDEAAAADALAAAGQPELATDAPAEEPALDEPVSEEPATDEPDATEE